MSIGKTIISMSMLDQVPSGERVVTVTYEAHGIGTHEEAATRHEQGELHFHLFLWIFDVQMLIEVKRNSSSAG